MLYEDLKVIICQVMCISLLTQNVVGWLGFGMIFYSCIFRISSPIRTNGKPLAAIGKFPSAIGKFIIGKILATSGEEITNAMIGNDVLAIYW